MSEPDLPPQPNLQHTLRYAAWVAVAVALVCVGAWTIYLGHIPRIGPLTRETGDSLIQSKFTLTDQTGHP